MGRKMRFSGSPDTFSAMLFEKMKHVNPGIEELELYEFRYALNNLYPENGGWASVEIDAQEEIENQVNDISFYSGIQIKPKVDGRIVLDDFCDNVHGKYMDTKEILSAVYVEEVKDGEICYKERKTVPAPSPGETPMGMEA